jgi:hypothetical protein
MLGDVLYGALVVQDLPATVADDLRVLTDEENGAIFPDLGGL